MAVDDRREGMTSLQELLTDAVAGKGRIAMVTGPVASGKSTLLYAFSARVFDQGALSLTATGSRAESGLPLGVVSQLIHDAPLTDEHRDLAMNLLEEGARSQLSADPRTEAISHVDVQMVEALCTVLLELAARCPLVISVDDVHHADRASQLCLAYLARRVKFENVMLVLSAPDHSTYIHTVLHTDLVRQPHCRPVRLAHLPQEGVERRLAELAGEETAERLSADCFALTGGNRLLVDALAEDYKATGAPGERYGEAVVECLRRMDDSMRQIARGLAVLGSRPAPSRDAAGLLPRMLGESRSDVDKGVQALTCAGVLDAAAQGRFRHDAAAAAVLDELESAELTGLHRRAAEAGHAEGVPSAEVAQHLLQAGHADEAPNSWTVTVLEEAARHELRTGGVEAAIEYLRLAWHACGDERQRAKITTTLVRAEWRINPSAPAQHLTELTDALHKGYLGGGDAVVLAKALLWHGNVAEARNVLEHLRGLEDLDQESIAEVAAARPWFRSLYPTFLPYLPDVSRAQAENAASCLGVGHRMEAAGALADVLTRGPREETVTTADRVLRGARMDEMTMDTVETALLTLTYADRPGTAEPWCDAFIKEAMSRSAPSRQARLSAIRAEIGLRRGDLAAAAQDARRALEVIPESAWGVAVGGPLGSLLLAGAAMGRVEEFLHAFDQPVPGAMMETRYGPHYLHAKGRFRLASDQAKQALRDFRLCGELMRQWGMDVPGFIAWRVDAAEALIRMGDPEEARRLIDEQMALRIPQTKRAQGMAMRLLAAVSEVRHRPMLLRKSADYLQDCGDRYELSKTLFDLTEAYTENGEHRRAGMFERRARLLSQRCQMETSTRGARGGDDQAAGESTKVLSEAERRVAALAAEGFTNREISARLFITVSTVEQHLTRTYRKLDITHRTELPASLAGAPSLN